MVVGTILFAKVVPHLFEFVPKRSPLLPVGLFAADLFPRQLEFERETILLQGRMKQWTLSRHGRRFVYRTFGDEAEGLRIMDMASKKITSIASGYDNFPLWSPRGDLIMFSRNEGGNYEIWTIHPDGTNAKQLTHSRGNDAHMSWSPDGEYIVFASGQGSTTALTALALPRR